MLTKTLALKGGILCDPISVRDAYEAFFFIKVWKPTSIGEGNKCQ